MPEMTTFEARLASALQARVRAINDHVDAAAVAARVVAEPRPRLRWPQLSAPVIGDAVARRWLVIGAVLLAMLVGLALIGGPLILKPEPRRITAPTIVDVVVPRDHDQRGFVASADGSLWRLGFGRLTRLDMTTSATRTWDVADDPRFLASVMTASRDGGVWLGSGTRLVRFDGTTFHEPLPALPADVWSIAEAPDGTVWAGVQGEILRLDGGRWTSFAMTRLTAYPQNLVIDAAGRPWVVSMVYPGPVGFQIARLDAAGWTVYERPSEVPDMGTVITSLAALRDGGALIGTNRGVVRYAGGTWTSLGRPTTPAGIGADTYTVAEASDGTIWAGMAGATGLAIARLDADGWHADGPDDGLPASTEYVDLRLVPTAAGMVAAINGVPYQRTDGTWLPRVAAPQGTDTSGLPIAVLSDDEAWLIERRPGADPQAPRLWHVTAGVARLEPGTATGAILHEVATLDGRPVVAGSDGVATWTGAGWDRIDDRPALDLAVAPDGRVWVVGDDTAPMRILARSASAWRSTDLPEPPLRGQIAVDLRGNAWMIGPRWDWPREGLARFDGISWELVKLLPSPPAFEGLDLAFGDIAIAPNGDVWVTIVGSRLPSSCCADMAEWRVGRFDGSSWTFYGAADGLWSGESGQFLQLAITADGRAWVSNDGLAGFDGTRWTISLPGTLPGLLAASPDGGLWASGEVGVVRIGLPKT